MAGKSTPTAKAPEANAGVTADWRNSCSPLELLQSRGFWYIGVLVVVVAACYWGSLSRLARRWANEPDYSHGFLVPVFAAYLLWHRRGMAGDVGKQGSWWGLAFLAVGGGMRFAGEYLFYPLLEAPSLIPCLAGMVLLVGGWKALHWAWPSLVYLIFMVPLPGMVAGMLSNPLQYVATTSSTWLLQTIGLPAVSRGNVISLSNDVQIGVVEACSGLRMLMLFLAITVGASFVIKRPLWEKMFVSVSALLIAVLTNILRITVTAILYEYVGAELAEKVFHDLAGWLMMPAAMLLLMLELYVLSKLLVTPTETGPILVHR